MPVRKKGELCALEIQQYTHVDAAYCRSAGRFVSRVGLDCNTNSFLLFHSKMINNTPRINLQVQPLFFFKTRYIFCSYFYSQSFVPAIPHEQFQVNNISKFILISNKRYLTPATTTRGFSICLYVPKRLSDEGRHDQPSPQGYDFC